MKAEVYVAVPMRAGVCVRPPCCVGTWAGVEAYMARLAAARSVVWQPWQVYPFGGSVAFARGDSGLAVLVLPASPAYAGRRA